MAQGSTTEILSGRSQHRFYVTVADNETQQTAEALRAAGLAVIEQVDTTFVIEPPLDVGGRDLNRLLASTGVYASSINRPVASLEDAFLDLVQQPETHVTQKVVAS